MIENTTASGNVTKAGVTRMTKKIDEQLSTLVDGELANQDAALEQVAADSQLKARWSRYHLIRDVVSGHVPEQQPFTDIAGRVSQALEDEPAILAPLHKRKRAHKIPYIMKQIGGLAIAATVSAVAVITVQQTQQQSSSAPTEIAVAQPQSKPSAQVRYVSDTTGLDTAVQSKLDGYLVNHNEYSASAKMQGLLPYMRIVSETPGKKVVVRSVNEQQ
jgi:sigma-E factor negative regulatory protein RseA